MKIEKEIREDHQVKLTVEIEPELFEKTKRRAARKIARKIKIPGFRPGKAPYGVIVRQVGEASIVEEALEILVDEQYPKIIDEAEIEPYGPGTLENVPSLDPPTFEFIVPLRPEVELGDYTSLKFPYQEPEIQDEQVEQVISDAQNRYAQREQVERPAQTGDAVYLQINARRTDTEDEEKAIVFEDRFSVSVIQEDEDPDEFPFPGFSQNLIGLSKGDEKTVVHQFPEDYADEDLQGATVEFHVEVTNVESRALPELNDEFAQTASPYPSMEEWRQEIRKNLEMESKSQYQDEYDDLVIDKLVEASVLKYPPQVVEREKEELLRGLEQNLARQGLSKEIYLKIRGMSEEELLEEVTPLAETRVKRALVLMEVAKAENIEPESDEVQAETGRTMEYLTGMMTPNDAKKFLRSSSFLNLVGSIVADLTTQKTVQYLRAIAKGEPWPPETDQGEEGEEPASGEPQPEAIAETGAEDSQNQPEEDTPPEATPTAEDVVAPPEAETEPEAGDSAEGGEPPSSGAEESSAESP